MLYGKKSRRKRRKSEFNDIDPHTCFFPLYVLPKIVLLVYPNNLGAMSRVNPDPVMSSIHTEYMVASSSVGDLQISAVSTSAS